jgi:hypothetical protein
MFAGLGIAVYFYGNLKTCLRSARSWRSKHANFPGELSIFKLRSIANLQVDAPRSPSIRRQEIRGGAVQ